MLDLILSLAVDGREKYSERVKDLIESLRHIGARYEVYHHFPVWVTPHDKVPYAFKYDLILDAMKRGYDRVWWLDSTMRLLKDPFELFRRRPVVAFDNLGHPLNDYITKEAAGNMKLCMTTPWKQCWGGALGWDFTNGAADVLREVYKQISLGSFHDTGTAVKAHRHDQAVMSGLLRGDLLPYGLIAAKKHVTSETYIQYGD